MDKDKSNEKPKTTKGGALDVDVPNVDDFDQESKLKPSGQEDEGIAPDELISQRARAEAVRQHGDVYIVESDLEDDDQRSATPGVREQP
ncbi:MAG TPA: hypothetical protein VM468_12745 [Mycoplana sp.]|nr:hypothetical protein [Mycoplana sp.]